MSTRLFLVAPVLMLLAPQHLPTPGVRFGHSMIYDAQQRRVVLLDGYTWVRAVSPAEPPERSELWAWNGSAWNRVDTAGPSPRTMGRAVYDPVRGCIVSAGGRVGHTESPSDQTWEWCGGAWRLAAEKLGGPNVHFEMAYDATRGSTVRYGGAVRAAGGGFAWPTTTWMWTGRTWTVVGSDGPPGRAAAHMVYDGRRNEVVMFGGQGAAPAVGQPQPLFGDTWVWDGRRWRRAASDGPSARSFHAMSFDSRSGLVLLHGGAAGDRILEDLWAWDGTRWTGIPQPGAAPGRRRLHAMIYDAARDRTVLYGGVGPDTAGRTRGYDDTWEWDGSQWTRAQ
jgi:hypothetical protein